MTKHPKTLPMQDQLNDTQRKSLGLPLTPPRVRQPGEATSITLTNSTMRESYSTGNGEVAPPIRQGAMRAMEIESRGVRT